MTVTILEPTIIVAAWGILDYRQRQVWAIGERINVTSVGAQREPVRLNGLGVNRAAERKLRRHRQLYQTYPQIRESVPAELTKHLGPSAARESLPIRESATPESNISGKALITRISFTRIAELIANPDPVKRARWRRGIPWRPA